MGSKFCCSQMESQLTHNCKNLGHFSCNDQVISLHRGTPGINIPFREMYFGIKY